MTTEETPMQQLKRKLQESIGNLDPLDDMSEISYSVALKNVVKDIDAQMLSIEKAYSESLAKERAVEVLREMINKKKAEFESLKESAPHSNDSMRSCRIGIVTLLSAIEEMNDTFFAEKRKEGAE